MNTKALRRAGQEDCFSSNSQQFVLNNLETKGLVIVYLQGLYFIEGYG